MLVVGFQFTGLLKAVDSLENSFYENCNTVNWWREKRIDLVRQKILT